MADAQRILVVAGARALSRTPAARLWALAAIARVMHDLRATAVCHGACPDSPDTWADDLAKTAHVTRVRWPIDGGPHILWQRDGACGSRPIAHAELYTYEGPHPRNATMARWAGHELTVEHHDVCALTLRCPWPMTDGRTTHGTAHARNELVRAIGAARVVDLVCPRELGPVQQ